AVAGRNTTGEGSLSSQVSTIPQEVPAAPTTVDVAPGNAQVGVSWSAVATATQYVVYYSTSSPVTTASANVVSASSPRVVSGLINGTPYYFKVAPRNAVGAGPLSAERSATPMLPPGIPGQVSATPQVGAATVSWSPAANATEHVVYYGTSSPVTTSSASVQGATSPQQITGL